MPDLIKPFTMDSEQAKELTINIPKEPELIKPFTHTEDPNTKPKLYLILKYYVNDDVEDEKTWEFFKGTSQELYDHIKAELLQYDNPMDVMKSRVLVDSPKVTISYKYTVAALMRNYRAYNKVKDESSFDINEYIYEDEESNDDNND